MSNPKVSVVIPISNIENYLEESFNSILTQSIFDDIEVLMIDTGSQDSSRYIIERYALDYDNFHAYHIGDAEVAAARNHGLQLAKGDYIHFMNPTDFIDCDIYEKAYSLASENSCDIVIGNAAGFDRYNVSEQIIIENNCKISSADECPSILKSGIVMNKLFKREFLLNNDIAFGDEDEFVSKSLDCADSMYLTKDIFYYWRMNSDDYHDDEYSYELTDVSNDDENAFVSFKFNGDNEISQVLLKGDEEHLLEVKDDNIVIPAGLIKDSLHPMAIKMKCSDVDSEIYLKSDERHFIRFDDFDLEFGIGINHTASIKTRKTNDDVIEIDKVVSVKDKFDFIAKSDCLFDGIIMENLTTNDKFEYDVIYLEDKIIFSVPYADICSSPIRKWEIKSNGLFDKTKITREFILYNDSNKIAFSNQMNKILIEDDVYNKFDELNKLNKVFGRENRLNYNLNEENKKLRVDNNYLKKQRVKLKDTIRAFKSRKIIKISDKFRI